jgi:hypothetical protein
MVIFSFYLKAFSSRLLRTSVAVIECGDMAAAASNRRSPTLLSFWNQRHGFFFYPEVCILILS